MAPKKAKKNSNQASRGVESTEIKESSRYNLRKRPAKADEASPRQAKKRAAPRRQITGQATAQPKIASRHQSAVQSIKAEQGSPAARNTGEASPIGSILVSKPPSWTAPTPWRENRSLPRSPLPKKSPPKVVETAPIPIIPTETSTVDNRENVPPPPPPRMALMPWNNLRENLHIYAQWRQTADKLSVVPPWGIVEPIYDPVIFPIPRTNVVVGWPDTSPANIQVDGEFSEASEDEEERLVDTVLISPIKYTWDMTQATNKIAKQESFNRRYKEMRMNEFIFKTRRRWQKLQTRAAILEINNLENLASFLTGAVQNTLLRTATVLRNHIETVKQARLERNRRRMQNIRATRAANRTQLIAISKIEESQVLGEGSFGRVYAWKQSDIRTINENWVVKLGRGKDINTEKAWFRRLLDRNYWHPCIIGFKEEEQIGTESRIWSTLFLQRANLGDLEQFRSKMGWVNRDLVLMNRYYPETYLGSYLLTDRTIFQWFIQILSGLAYLHKGLKADGTQISSWAPIVHGDLKLANVLVHWDFQQQVYHLMIADFGLSHFDGENKFPFGATAAYTSPEFHSAPSYDVWCCGAMLHDLLNNVWIRRPNSQNQWATDDKKHPEECRGHLSNYSYFDRWWCQPPNIVPAHEDFEERNFSHCRSISLLMYRMLGRVPDAWKEDVLPNPPLFARRLTSVDSLNLARKNHDQAVEYMHRDSNLSFVEAANECFEDGFLLIQLVDWNKQRFEMELKLQNEAVRQGLKHRPRKWFGVENEHSTLPTVSYGVRNVVEIPENTSALDAYKLILDEWSKAEFTFGNVEAAINNLVDRYQEFDGI